MGFRPSFRGARQREPGISRFRVRCFASPRNDGVRIASSLYSSRFQTAKTFLDTRSRPRGAMRPSHAFIFRPPFEGVGNAGCPLHPRSRVHFVLVERTRVTTSTPESPGIPARNGFTAYVGLSPVTGLFCHRRLRKRGLSAPGRADTPSAKT
jgi:hypothetical protein